MVKLPHSWATASARFLMASRYVLIRYSVCRAPCSMPAQEGKSYFELFDFLLWKEKLLAVGIYRTALGLTSLN